MYSFKKAGQSVLKTMTTMSCFKPLKPQIVLSTQSTQSRNFGFKPRYMSKTSEHLESYTQESMMTVPNYFASGERSLTRVERDLVKYLTKEVVLERKAQKVKNFPMFLEGFAIKMRGSEIELSKQTTDQEIFVKMNVANTVDAYGCPENEEADGRPLEIQEMRSKPRFEVDFIKGNVTLSFNCSFIRDAVEQDCEYNDVFSIDEICLFEGRHNGDVYAVAGDVLDDSFYDLLMNFLEEKGISNEFAKKLSDLATAYEHSMYINLLENLSRFTRDDK